MSWTHHVYSVVRQLTDVIRPSFGPLGCDQLLQSPSTLLITNSSSTILASLVTSPYFLPASTPVSHRAIAAIVLSHLRQCVDQHGDGSGAVLLMLEAAMHEVLAWTRELGMSDAVDSGGRGRARYVKMSQQLLAALDVVDREWIQVKDDGGEAVQESGLMTEMRAVGQSIDSSLPALLAASQQLLYTQLAGKFSSNVVKVLQGLVMDFISRCHTAGCSISNICESVRSVQPLAIATPASVSQSVVLRGLLLDRAVATRDMPARVVDVRLLVLTCTLSPDVSSATITIRSQDDYQRLLQSGEQSVRSLLSVARERGCNVLLSSVTQHPSTLQLCSQLSITVIQQLSDTEVQRVCRLTGAVPVSSPHEAATATLGRASLLRLLQLGNRVCVQLDMDGGVHVDYKPHTLVLAAASDGIAKQYQQAVMRAFSLLAHFTSLSSNSAAAPFLLPGAGATEFQLSIRCTARYGPTVPSSVGWRVMAAALLAVPRALYAAACSEDDVTYARFIEVETVVRAQVRRERSSVGIVLIRPAQCDVDSVTDWLQRPDDTSSLTLLPPPSLRLPPLLSLSSPLFAGVADSPAVKHSVIVCVLSLLRTLLRVDDCIQVRTKQPQVGRLVRARTAGQRRGKGWVNSSRDEGESSDDSDIDLSIQ